MYCNQCGNQTSNSAKFCEKCGIKIADQDTQQASDNISTPTNHQSWGAKYHKIAGSLVIVTVVMFFIWIFSIDTDSSSSINVSSQPEEKIYIPINQETRVMNSLPNGTIIDYNSSYLGGNGELTIKNGTNLDSVVKIISTRLNKSIKTFYVKENSEFTAVDILDGIYKVAVTQGQDWNSNAEIFNIDPIFFEFEDSLDFSTSYDEYTTWELTLHGVYGGSAQTDDINQNIFANY